MHKTKYLFPSICIFVLFRPTAKPLFSSHMLDLSEVIDGRKSSPVPSTARGCVIKLWLEMEIGITGGEDNVVDNTRS